MSIIFPSTIRSPEMCTVPATLKFPPTVKSPPAFKSPVVFKALIISPVCDGAGGGSGDGTGGGSDNGSGGGDGDGTSGGGDGDACDFFAFSASTIPCIFCVANNSSSGEYNLLPFISSFQNLI